MNKKIFLLLLISLFMLQPVFAFVVKIARPATPTYYTFEDLKAAANNYKGYFSFFNYYKPSNAYASLPERSVDSYPDYITICKVKAITAQGGYDFLSFPWYDSFIHDGDLVFLRATDAGSMVVRRFSTWTHVAMVYNQLKEQTFESLINKVNIYDYKNSWRNIVSYSVKRVKVQNPMLAVEAAVRCFAGKKPYFPTLLQSATDLRGFFQKWSDKWDLDSMYCSKLVWWTFRDYVDLDSNRTSSVLAGMWQSTNMDIGTYNGDAWIGVSPDDIYYSKNVSEDLLLAGEYNLREPLADSIF